ncbi:MAG: tRNA (N(6)-L-threonylcarbamoyladenosine(37)-C(2))-methylthiotransferase MtaB [SAR202 cluster bacterium]|nr:tRNA (N(6)-L-threonylcarbamoyladenosine(37)-C(2))-methylthiotransferase MtaB [SAR202 cluster bacterium]
MNPENRNRYRVAIETHGCKLNQADSMTLAREFSAAGFEIVDTADSFDAFVLNSCTVTSMADRKARQALRSARRRNPDATIVATGCYAQRSPEALTEISEIDIVLGNDDKAAVVERVAGSIGDAFQSLAGLDSIAAMTATRTRAMVKIQEGCNQVCAFCVVPRVRGREQSVAPEAIVKDILRFEALGFNEVVLTGTQLGSYGFDLPDNENLTTLVSRILESTSVPRVRVSSLQPQDIDNAFLDLWADQRLCPHFHLPLQSGSDAVLRRMRRRYDAKRFSGAVEAIRSRMADAAITADVIVGFPGETESEFRETVEICGRMEFADLHGFPYSRRPGTSAARLDDHVSPELKAARSQELLTQAADMASEFRRSLLGTTRPVLWESLRVSESQRTWTGLTDNYVRVRTVSAADLANTVAPTRLDGLDGQEMVGEVASEASAISSP